MTNTFWICFWLALIVLAIPSGGAVVNQLRRIADAQERIAAAIERAAKH